MLKRHNGLIIAAVVFSLALSLFGGDAKEDFEIYNKTVNGTNAKVFEANNKIIVYSLLPYNERKDDRTQVKMRVFLQANKLLKQWVVDYTAKERTKNQPESKGLLYAYSVIYALDPDVVLPWNVKFTIREMPHKTNNGFYTIGQIIDRDVLINNIPHVFYNPFSADFIFSSIETVVQKGMSGKNPDYFYKKCGLRDFVANDEGFEPEIGAEYQKANNAISQYLSKSELAKKIKTDKAEIEKPHVVSTWGEAPQGDPETIRNQSVSAVTNVLPQVAVSSNTCQRAESESERKDIGIATGGVITETITSSDYEKVVVKTTVTTTETHTFIRKKTVSSVVGKAKLQDIFLSAGTMDNLPSEIKPSAKKAKESFYGSADVATKEKDLYAALCENPGDKELWNLYGRLLLNRNENEAAVICFRASLKLDNKYEYALVNLSEAYNAMGLKNLSYGLAFVARGLSTNSWVTLHSEAILTAK